MAATAGEGAQTNGSAPMPPASGRGLLARLDAFFDPNRDFSGSGTLGLIVSDYVAFHSTTPTRQRWRLVGSRKHDPPRKLWLLFIPRLLNNPSLHATVLIRLAVASPRWMLGFWRTVLIAKHTIEIAWRMDIGPGLMMPHPYNISLGWGVTIGRNVTLMHALNIGARPPHQRGERISPLLEDDVVVYMQSNILGPVTIGKGAVIGAGTWVEEDVPPGEVVRRVPKEDQDPAATRR
jgi:serine O-acetyltransferase